MPGHPVAHQILAAFGKPVVAPSANRSGEVSTTTAPHVLHDLRDRIELLINDGPAPLGIESTIVACLDKPTLLRAGRDRPRGDRKGARRLPRRSCTTGSHRGHGKSHPSPQNRRQSAPGMLASHYAPRTPLRLDATKVSPDEALLAFGATAPAGAAEAVATLNLSPRGDLVEAAAHLFAHLRSLDTEGATAIAVAPIPAQGIGEAINDRLRHAAAPRENGGRGESRLTPRSLR